MAVKKSKKKPKMAKVESVSESCCCGNDGIGANLSEWLLILVGGFGLAYALGYVDWPLFTGGFQIAWPIIVIVVAMKNIMDKKNCC
jgi:hypothetical protein